MDISSIYTDYVQQQATSANNKKIQSSLKNADFSGASDEELMDVCKQFESYFVEQVLKQAMNTFTEGDQYSSGSMSTLTSYFKDNLMQEYAGKITEQQNFGLAQTLYEQMKRNYSPSVIPDAQESTEENSEVSSETDASSAVEAASTVLNEND